MAGSPIKHERNRLVRSAILRGLAEGKDPVEFVAPFTDKLQEMALSGDMSAMKELFDRIDGKAPSSLELSSDPNEPLRIVHESK